MCRNESALVGSSSPEFFFTTILSKTFQLLHSLGSANPWCQFCKEGLSALSRILEKRTQMGNERDRNQNAWAQLSHSDDFQSLELYTQIPDGYVLAQGYIPEGYVPTESENDFSDYSQSSTASSYHAPNEEVNAPKVDNDDECSGEEIRAFVSRRQKRLNAKTPAKPDKEQVQSTSKRAERRAKIAEENGGEIASNDQPKGVVEWREGVFVWWDPEDRTWLKAAYHDQFRHQMILEDSAEGTYVVAPEHGKHPLDITSVCSSFNQLEWRLTDRDSWGNIIDADGNQVMYLLNKPEHQTYEEPERIWIHEGCVLLDGDNNPVRPWAGVPRCFSSKVEGSRMEALRRILPMSIQDFRARMMRQVPTSAGMNATTKPLSYPSTFGHRSSRFRAQYQTPAWTSRAASDLRKKQVIDTLPEGEEATTTEGLEKLTRYEVERRKSSTRGQFLYKANGRLLSEEERKKRERKFDENLAKQAPKELKPLRQVQRMPATPNQNANLTSGVPTPPLSVGSKRRLQDDGFGGFGVDQSEPTAKRGRIGASPLDSRMQGRSPVSSTTPQDTLQRTPNAYDTPTSANVVVHTHQSGSGATGAGPSVVGKKSVTLQNISQIQNIDYRTIQPHTSLQQLRVQVALYYPRAHYYALTGEHPPRTSTGTYNDQYNQIADLLEMKWLVPGGVPQLADIGPWNGSFDEVPTPHFDEGLVWSMLHPDGVGAAEESSAVGAEDDVQEEELGDRGTGDSDAAGTEQLGKEGKEDWEDELFGDGESLGDVEDIF